MTARARGGRVAGGPLDGRRVASEIDVAWVAIIPGLLAALAIVYAIRRLPRLEAHERQPIRLRLRPVLHGRLGALKLGVGAFELGNIAATLLILRATELLEPGRGLDSATTVALLLYAGYNLAATLASIPAGHLGDRRGMVRVLVGGVALFAAAYLVLAGTGASVALILVGFVLAGVAIGCVETAEHAAVAALLPRACADRPSACWRRSRASATWPPAIAGLLWTLVSPEVAFIYAAAWMVVALGLLVGLPGELKVARLRGHG